MWRPVISSSRARPRPMILGANQVVPPFHCRWLAGLGDRRPRCCRRRGGYRRRRRSPSPWPSAQPLTRATTGFFSSRREIRNGWWTVIEESMPGVGVHSIEVVAGAERLLTSAAQRDDADVGSGRAAKSTSACNSRSSRNESAFRPLRAVQRDREYAVVGDVPDGDLPLAVGERGRSVWPGFVIGHGGAFRKQPEHRDDSGRLASLERRVKRQ